MCFTQILAECKMKIMRFHGRTIYDRAPHNEERQWKVLPSNHEKRLPSPLQQHQPCLHKEKCQQRPKTPLCSQGRPHSAREDKRQHLRMLSAEHKPCWKCEEQMQRELSSALVVPCRNLDSQRNDRADRARRPDMFGIVSLTSLVVKPEPLVDDDVDNHIKSTSPSLLPMLFGGQRERVSPTQMTQKERRSSSFFETSRTASLCRNSGRRQSCAQMGRDRPREGSR